MTQKLLARYGLKGNPFTPAVPTAGVYVAPKIENCCWRIEPAPIREGGFALLHGAPGSGKSVVMRLLAARACPSRPSAASTIRRATAATSSGNLAMSSASHCASTTTAAASQRYGRAGSIISAPPVVVHCC